MSELSRADGSLVLSATSRQKLLQEGDLDVVYVHSPLTQLTRWGRNKNFRLKRFIVSEAP